MGTEHKYVVPKGDVAVSLDPSEIGKMDKATLEAKYAENKQVRLVWSLGRIDFVLKCPHAREEDRVQRSN